MRSVCGSLKTYNSSILRDLHGWLRSPERIDFKLAVLVYRCLHGLAPHYLSDYCLFQPSTTAFIVILIRRTRLITVGDRAFPCSRRYSRLCHTSLRQLRLLLFSESGSKLIFSLVRSHCNGHTMY